MFNKKSLLNSPLICTVNLTALCVSQGGVKNCCCPSKIFTSRNESITKVAFNDRKNQICRSSRQQFGLNIQKHAARKGHFSNKAI